MVVEREQRAVRDSCLGTAIIVSPGVVAHICAASAHGPRYDASMTPAERSSISNALWLCSNHAALIDRDIATYTTGQLREMKRSHEAASAEGLRRASKEPQPTSDLVAIGPGIICTGEVIGVDSSGWSIQARHFVEGDAASLMAAPSIGVANRPGIRPAIRLRRCMTYLRIQRRLTCASVRCRVSGETNDEITR